MADLNLEALRESGRITSLTLDVLAKAAKPGVTTTTLNELGEKSIRDHGGVPAFAGYRGYPAAICTSVNEQVVHGIPGAYTLKEGDLLSIDLGVKVEGWHTDAAVTVGVGQIDAKAQKLLDITASALETALSEAASGRTTGDLGAAVEKLVSEAGFQVVRDCVGHGIGRNLHEEPSIPNFGRPGQGSRFKRDMVVAVEPMVVTGQPELSLADDHWTLSTKDQGLAAHFEETVIITDREPVRLTPLPRLAKQEAA